MTVTCQGECQTEYTSWQRTPQRGYEWSKGEFVVLTPEELAEAKAARAKVDSMKVEKAVDFEATATKYVYGKAYYLLPPEGANETSAGAYRTVCEVVRESGRAILVRFMPRDKVRHYAVVASPEDVLIAYEIRDRRDLPYDVPTAPANPKQKAQGKALIDGMFSDDPTLEPEPDPVFELVQRKVAERGSLEGIGQTVIVPQQR